MRIVKVFGHGQEPVVRQGVGHERHGHPSCQPCQQFGKFALQMQPRGDHEFRPRKPVGVAGRRPIGMWIDASRHQAVDGHTVSADLPDEVGHHRRGGDHGRGRLIRPRGGQEYQDDRDRGQQAWHKIFWAVKKHFLIHQKHTPPSRFLQSLSDRRVDQNTAYS